MAASVLLRRHAARLGAPRIAAQDARTAGRGTGQRGRPAVRVEYSGLHEVFRPDSGGPGKRRRRAPARPSLPRRGGRPGRVPLDPRARPRRGARQPVHVLRGDHQSDRRRSDHQTGVFGRVGGQVSPPLSTGAYLESVK